MRHPRAISEDLIPLTADPACWGAIRGHVAGLVAAREKELAVQALAALRSDQYRVSALGVEGELRALNALLKELDDLRG
jgi:hypothetical protein